MDILKNFSFCINKKLIIYTTITAIIIGLTVGVWINVGIVYKSSHDIKSEKETMIKTIDKYNIQAKEINKEPYRPVDSDLINNVESNIMMMLEMHNLNLENFNPEQKGRIKDTKSNGEIYDLTFTGTWQNTIDVLTNWHSKDALIGIKYLEVEPMENVDVPQMVKTTLQYKIYKKTSSKKENKNVSNKNKKN